jgi:predicted phosphodiesterase
LSDKPIKEKHWHREAIAFDKAGWSYNEIAEYFELGKSTVSDFFLKLKGEYYGYNRGKKASDSIETIPIIRAVRRVDTDQEDNRRVLFISDLHIPYHHPDTFKFLQYLKDKHKPTRVICLGDELDKHALSYHDHDPDLPSAGDELRKAQDFIKQLFEMFPKMDIIESNHGSLVWRKAKTHGIPRHYIKGYNDVLGVDDGWRWCFDLTISLPNGNLCYVHHGKTNNVLQLSQQMGMCAVQGHYHETFKIDYWGNPTGLYWGMQCGCLVDDNSLALSYNNVNIKRPIIGTGLIINSLPVLEPMVLNHEGEWVGE